MASEKERIFTEYYTQYFNKLKIYLMRRIVLDKATYKEMSDELGIKLWACQKRMQRIIQKLRNHFKNLE